MGLDNLDQNYFDPNFQGDNHPWGETENYENWLHEQSTLELSKLEIAISALEAIAEPVSYLKSKLEEGDNLNGMAVIMITEKPTFYQEIAKKALEDIKVK